jgi:dihydroxyacetone kinase phosphoprotein-dependent L subunit
MTTDNAATARLCLTKALDAISAAEQELGKLDAAAGDGDHGMGMVRGFKAAVAAAEGDGTPGQVLGRAGAAFGDAAGGASGALVGAFISTIGGALQDQSIAAVDIARALEAGLNMLTKLGKAKVGDKTMIDTLDPFVKAYADAANNRASITAAWSQALPAAEAGMKTTADMVSKRGRSSRLGERSRGTLDPGSVSMYYALKAVGDALNEACPAE